MKGLFSIGFNDVVKGLIVAVLTAIATIVQQTIETGSLTFNWLLMGKTALLATIAYLLKNFMSNSSGEFAKKDPK